MFRKLLLALLPLFILFILSSRPTMAANSCGTMTINTIAAYDAQAIDFTITGSQFLTVGAKYHVYYHHPMDVFAGTPLEHNDLWDTATVTADGAVNGKISFTHHSGASLYSKSTDTYIYFRFVNPDGSDGTEACRQSITIIDPASKSLGICNINLAGLAIPGAPQPSDSISFTVSNSPVRSGLGLKRYIAVFNQDAIDQTLSKCVSDSAVAAGYSLGTGLAGNYSIQVRENCSGISGFPPSDPYGIDNFDPTQAILCDHSLSSVNGGGSDAQGLACKICPALSNWDNVQQKCYDGKGTEVAYVIHTCQAGTICNPQNSETENPICIAIGAGITIGQDATRTDVCPEALVNGTCPKIPSGFGVDLKTNVGDFINELLGIFLSISGGIAILLIIIAGYRVMTSQGNPEKLQGAREGLTAAIVGLLFVVFSLVILEVVGVDILNIFSR